MKVSDIMRRSIVTATEDTPLKEVGRLIFTLGIAGIPVIRGKKLVGIVTESDILSKMHPTIQEVIEDYARATDFESMAKNMRSLLEVPVSEVMNPRVTSVTSDTPLMKAHSLMLINGCSRLPIVNKNNELIGIISQGDVFRNILKDEMPKIEKERYSGFLYRHYDKMVNWDKRFSGEFPTLFKLFEKNKVKNILDVGVWTGEYTIGLVKRSNYSILGLDHNPIMIRMSNEKKAKLTKELRKRVRFALTDFTDLSAITRDKFDALICMGNALPYINLKPITLFKEISKIMSNNSVAVIQLLNFEKVLASKNRLLSFNLHKTSDGHKKEQLSIEFFDQKNKDILSHNTIIFDNDGANWIYKEITTVDIYNIQKEDIKDALVKSGFKKVSFFGNEGEYQGDYGELSLEEEFKPLESDWLTVVAERQ